MQIHSIFESISGEAGGFPQGTWCTFIRTQGCSLPVYCAWCDTPEAQEPDIKKEKTVKEILSQVGTKHVLITGGEPLYQRIETIKLIEELVSYGHIVQVETNGHHAVPDLGIEGRRVNWVVDYKTPSSGAQYEMRAFHDINGFELQDLNALHIKFVIGGPEDLAFALDRMQELRDSGGRDLKFILSPLDADKDMVVDILDVIKRRSPWLLDQVIFSIQLHKILKMP